MLVEQLPIQSHGQAEAALCAGVGVRQVPGGVFGERPGRRERRGGLVGSQHGCEFPVGVLAGRHAHTEDEPTRAHPSAHLSLRADVPGRAFVDDGVERDVEDGVEVHPVQIEPGSELHPSLHGDVPPALRDVVVEQVRRGEREAVGSSEVELGLHALTRFFGPRALELLADLRDCFVPMANLEPCGEPSLAVHVVYPPPAFIYEDLVGFVQAVKVPGRRLAQHR